MLGACQDITPGYLQTEYAGYTMDSMVVKKVLDLTPPKPNPTFEMYVNYGYTPEYCVQNGIYPTIGGMNISVISTGGLGRVRR